ncbi:phospholipid-transporting ATPase ABCA3-like [Coccinella septempunctata]|uniref:phospholipid-transporting ATPase ABCA3-like n=1 Tax=Coccinella septempunctata TaxID=41139 RepID=UPI001D0629E2|nr:phospholipid-transporting ATPase ABCA3-like [Coccinella septempunctata]
MGCWNKFRLLMWKNWKLQSRRPIAFIVEIAIPLLIIAIFVFVRHEIRKTDKPEEIYEPKPIFADPQETNVKAYCPNDNKLINDIMASFPNARPFENASAMEQYLTRDNSSFSSDLGIQFNRHMSQELSNNKNISITFRFDNTNSRWHTEQLFPPFEIGYNNRNDRDADYPSVFAPLMYTLTEKLLRYSGKPFKLPKMLIQRFPHPSYIQDFFLISMNQASLFGYLFMTAFIYTHINIVKSITYEKEKQLKESMKIMGLPTWLHWTAWFCKFIIPYLVITIFLVVMMKYETKNGPTLLYADCCLLFTFFLLFLSAMITYSFALSVFFTKANRASAMAGVIWVISLVPYVMTRNRNLSKGPKYLASLSVVSAMAHGFDVIILQEGSMEGIHWNNLFKSDLENDITFGGILLMIIADLILYMLIALYVEAIYPGEFGVPQKWYFILTPGFWRRRNVEQDDCLLDPNNGEFFDDDPTDLRAGISIRGLAKNFGSNEAVRDISLNMYEDQITVLLGHNGAGKTTTMSMLTGMFPPTKGTAIVNGFDIRTQIMSVRDSMGVCPQHNVLFDELTVREHLIFFSRLKGCTGSKVDEEVEKFLKLLSLEDKADSKSTQLSGGMKRKLSVGIALCGNSKIIMLDEPTAGMDPTARRFIWEFLQKQKKGRTILLTTHFMDEADLLGDRIAIMSGGVLQCCGTSFFLKKKFGAGYHLVIDQTSTCNPNNITNVIRKYIPNIEIESNAGTELTYLLPENYSPKFTHLLAELENNSEELGIRSFGISLTDLEEVFMKVGKSKTSKDLPKTRDNRGDGSDANSTNVPIGISNKERGVTLYVNQCIAIALKKLLSVKRTWGTELLKIVLSLVYIILVFSIDLSDIANQTFKQRSFDLNQYDKPITLVETNGNLQEPYVNMLHNMKQNVEFTDNMTERLLDLTKKSPYLVRYRYIVGASFKNDEAHAWFNPEPYHSVPLSLQLLLQQNYKTALGEDFNINFVNFPLPMSASDKVVVGLEYVLGSFNLISLSLAVAYIGSFYILFNIKEKMSQAKHLQFVSGVNIFVFRLVSFVCDMLTYLLSAVAIVITIAILKPVGLSTGEELGILFLLLFSFGVAMIPWMYLFSFLFTIPSTGYARMFFLSFITGFPSEMIVLLLVQMEWKHATLVKWIMRCFPHFNFIEGVQVLIYRHICDSQMKLCLKELPAEHCASMMNATGCSTDNILSFDGTGIGPNIMMLYLIALVTFLIIFLIDQKIITYLIYIVLDSFKRPPNSSLYVDPDVMQENEFVKSQPLYELQSRFALVLRDLTKHYCRLTAVNGLNLTVKKSECFGLLGVNGAGKTTTFRMMTGDEMISYGDGWINGFSIRNDMKKVHRFIGYCPQFDALLDNLTARETLKIFSLIRGVPRDECDFTAVTLAKDFDFTEHLDKEVAQLSGGNKRKLSTAIALIGDAPIIFLDEPTTGMDPATKRHLWNNLSKIRESGKSIILTSHSMEECEALCTRLTIMVNGNFQCLGSVQHLKSKFAEGYCVTLKIRKPANSSGLEHSDTTAIENYMVQNFPAAELREKHQELLTYYIKDRNITWSKLFGILEQSKGHLDIEDYSVGQASLEQVKAVFSFPLIHKAAEYGR